MNARILLQGALLVLAAVSEPSGLSAADTEARGRVSAALRARRLVFHQPYRDFPSTQALTVEVSRYQFSPGGPAGPPIVLQAGVSCKLTFRSREGTHGLSAIAQLGIGGSVGIAPGLDYVVTVTPTLDQRGARYNFTCVHFCGSGHGSMHGAIEIQ
jgi:heme/copper-type cytochrome/quinol oxidase subunit 2